MKNKKGFTLVELLAVIVILALIMSIAIVSIGGILNSSRQSTFKETAASIINGVRQQLTLANRLEVGQYTFDETILEKGGTSPFGGGKFNFATNISSCTDKIGANICKTSGLTCSSTSPSFVTVTQQNNVYTYKICLTDSTSTSSSPKKYIKDGEEKDLLNNNKTDMIQ